MNKTSVRFILSISFLVFLLYANAQTNQRSPYTTVAHIPETYQTFPLGSVRPLGWLKKQLQQNMDGFTGHLDSLAPDLILHDDIYGKDRITKRVKSKEVGAVGEAGDWQAQYLWWNSETQSNWRDGYIRTAVLLNDKRRLKGLEQYIQRILSTQDADGYLGIYDKDLRYSFANENGELWSKATLLRGLLAWFDYSKDQRVFLAIKKAVENVMINYPKGQSHPFFSKKPFAGGLTHGLAFTDVLEQLYQITKDRKYLDYLLFLYKDFSEQTLNEDGQYKKLLDTVLPLKGHGVHTYEHLRSVAAAYYASGNALLGTALQNYLQKIGRTTSVSGAPIGDEFIGGRVADATTGYEYCSLHELLDSYASLFAKTGDAGYGDKIETLFFNAAQGARHPSESAICYLKTDNSYFLTGGKNGDTSDKYQTRYRYSPVHKEAAVCCVPNAGRIAPAFVQHAWMRKEDTLVATLFAPCELVTQIKGQQVQIIESTDYPYENTIRFEIKMAKPLPVVIKIRKPQWATGVVSSVAYVMKGDFLIFFPTVKSTRRITVQFKAAPVAKTDNKQQAYFLYGPLVLAHPIDAVEQVTKRFPVSNLGEFKYTPQNLVIYNYSGERVTKDKAGKMLFHARLLNPQTNEVESISLEPMGETILRQVTFKKTK